MNTYLKRAALLPFYLVFVGTFGLSAYTKFAGPGTPPWFIEKFQGSILNAFPGALPINFYLIAVLEAATALGFLISLARMEFLPGRRREILSLSLFLAMLDFAMLGFGLRLTGDFNGAFQLFTYFVLTFLVYGVIQKDGAGANSGV